jgi:hypothetical protein
MLILEMTELLPKTPTSALSPSSQKKETTDLVGSTLLPIPEKERRQMLVEQQIQQSQSEPSFLLLDIRSAEEYETCRIVGGMISLIFLLSLFNCYCFV